MRNNKERNVDQGGITENTRGREKFRGRRGAREKGKRKKEKGYVKYKMGWSSSAKVPHGSCVNVLQKKPKAPAPPSPPPAPPSSLPAPGPFRLRETSSRIFTNGQDHNGNEFSRWTSLRFWPHPVPPSFMIYGFINATYNASPNAGRGALINRFISATLERMQDDYVGLPSVLARKQLKFHSCIIITSLVLSSSCIVARASRRTLILNWLNAEITGPLRDHFTHYPRNFTFQYMRSGSIHVRGREVLFQI